MRIRLAAIAGLLALGLAAGPALAQTTPPPPVVGGAGTALAAPDPNNSPFYGEVSLTVGVAGAAVGRSLKAVCTVAGNVAVTYFDGSTGTWAVALGTQTLPIAITEVNSSGTTATCTYFNLK